MRKLLYIGTALATFDAAFLHSAGAFAAGGYWNNSGFSISHQFFPGLQAPNWNWNSYSYFNYAPRYSGFKSSYIGGSESSYAAGPEATPAPIGWAKKCGSSCLDLSGDR